MNVMHLAGLAALALLSSGCGSTRRPDTAATSSGRMLFRMNCASCHGEDGGGNGPIAPLLKVSVPDLTRIAERRNGEFPDEEIFRIIDGQAPSNGMRHMPVWGYEFFGTGADDESAHAQATERVDRLVSYLRGIQHAR